MVSNHVVEDVSPNVRIHSTQRVVKQVDFRVLIHCSSKTGEVRRNKNQRLSHLPDALLLATGQVDSLLADLSHVAAR